MTRTIADVRASQEAVKDHWSSAVREAIIDVLRRKGEFHADDLAELGIPDEHRNVIGSQVARLVNQHWMVECGRRKSAVPSRNGAKSNVYKLTREGVSGVGAGKPAPSAQGVGPGVQTEASADPSDTSIAEELEEVEQQLFEPTPISSSSAFNPENPWA